MWGEVSLVRLRRTTQRVQNDHDGARRPRPHPKNHGMVTDCTTEKTDNQAAQTTQEVTPHHDHRWGLSTATSGDSNMAVDTRRADLHVTAALARKGEVERTAAPHGGWWQAGPENDRHPPQGK
jgi:hypothetical protein